MRMIVTHTPDADLWQRVKQGDLEAFEVVVRRHQSLVSAVAYNCCGDLAASEDVTQETFWTAWRKRDGLQEPAHMRGWLCGIARNLARNARRKAHGAQTVPLSDAAAVASDVPGPVERAVSREEETLLWQTLERIPEKYREPLILYYRQGQSIAEVAEALELSPDTVKQRLTRGRAMLKERVAGVVEGTLQRSRPGRGLTVAIMAGVASLSTVSKAAAAGTGVAALTTPAALATGALGGLGGSALGLFGTWLGFWLPAQVAATRAEREYIQRVGRRVMLVSAMFVIVLAGLIVLTPGRLQPLQYLVGLAVWFVAYWAYTALECIAASRVVQRLRLDPNAQPNDSLLGARLTATTSRWRGRVFRSRASFLGLPLLDINVSDPVRPDGSQPGPHVARGWIAIGDHAQGVLAIGGVARGLVAIGGRALGGVSIGGIATGVVAVGGLAMGGLCVGGLSLGVLSVGGLALGWQACGGGALAVDVACGGGAAAWHAAYGGAAMAHDYAVGGAAFAAHVNDAAARAVLADQPMMQIVNWQMANAAWFPTGIVVACLTLTFGMWVLLYRREQAGERQEQI